MKRRFFVIASVAIFLILNGCETIKEKEIPSYYQEFEFYDENYEDFEEKITVPERKYDSDILDYLNWRGDLTFRQDPFNEVDAIVFAQLTYIHYNGIISSSLWDKKTLAQVAREFERAKDFEERSYNGPFINPETIILLKMAANTERFKNVQVCYFVDEIDLETSKQFSAFTAFLDDGTAVVAYRGTHAELIGWKEDFDMAYQIPVPSQTRSVEYLEEVAKTSRYISIVGHSKGGNLALYAPAFCSDEARKHVKKIYNFDGQGFDKSIISMEEFKIIEPLVLNIKPQSSVVGMIFTGIGQTKIVRSVQENILLQHDPFSWRIVGNQFEQMSDRSYDSYRIELMLNNLLDKMTIEHRRTVVQAIYGAIEVSGAQTLQEFQEEWPKNSSKMLRYLNNLDGQTKRDVNAAIKIFLQSSNDSSRKMQSQIMNNFN